MEVLTFNCNKNCNKICSKLLFKIEDVLNNKNYLFVGTYQGIDLILNKINREGFESLTNEEEKKIATKYDIKLLKKSINKNTILIKDFINKDDTIETIKKKIMVYINPESPPNKQYLWIEKQTVEEIYLEDTLSFEYIDNISQKLQLNCDITDTDLQKSIENIDVSYNEIDNRHVLLETYEQIKNNTIYYISYDDYIEKFDELLPEKLTVITNIYFPFIKKKALFDDYKTIIKDNAKINNEYEDTFLNIEEKNILDGCSITNVVLELKYQNIEPKSIFNIIKNSEEIPFCKYRSKMKEEFFKIYTKPIEFKTVTTDFKNPSNYIIDYDPKKYTSNISKKTFLKWTQKEIMDKEKSFLKIRKELDLSYESNYEEVIIKFVYKNNYIDINFYENKIVLRTFNIYEEIDYYDDLLKEVNKYLVKLNKLLLRTKINIENKEWNFVTCDYKNNISLKTKLNKIDSNISTLSDHIYKIKTTNKNEILLKYKKVNNFDSFDNMKRFFIKLRKSNSTLSLSEFNDAWKAESKHIFNLSELEAASVLTDISQVVDTEELKKNPMDIDIDITITQNYSDTKGVYNYKIDIKNCDNLNHLNRIKKMLLVLFTISGKKQKQSQSEENAVPELEITSSKFSGEDEFELDDDLVDLGDDFGANDFGGLEDDEFADLEGLEEELEEIQQDEETEQEAVTNEVNEDEQEIMDMDKNTIRNYMKEMRKKDKKLFDYSTSIQFKNYSRNCQANYMRQPIILSKIELKNFEKKNPEGFNELTKIEWGSSKSSKHFYICPRIWCVRDKISLTVKQLLENNGTCPFCTGEIVDKETKIIEGNKTVIIRGGGSNEYWANNRKEKDAIKKYGVDIEKWRAYLGGTEEEAYPGFLDPAVHPEGFCMPCCGKKPNEKYGKCLFINIDYSIEDKIPKTQLDEIKEGYLIDGHFLKTNNTVLIKSLGIIVKITKQGMTQMDKFGKYDLHLQPGMFVNITKYPKKRYEINENEDKSQPLEFVSSDIKLSNDQRYVLSSDKFPLLQDKMGLLDSKLDEILNDNSGKFIYKSRIIDSASIERRNKTQIDIFIRKGIEQVNYMSFLNSIASFKNTKTKSFDYKNIIEDIIQNLTPIDFLGLNSGDLFKLFSSTEDNITTIFTDSKIFIEWCKTYIETIDYLIEINSKTSSLKELKTHIDSKKRFQELLEQSIQDKDKDILFLVTLFYSFEQFKKYCGDYNIPKEEHLFIDLFSSNYEWLFPEGLNILIIENKDKKIYMNCPLIEDIKTIYTNNKPISIIYKHRHFYEPIIIVQANNQNDNLKLIRQIQPELNTENIEKDVLERLTNLNEIINDSSNCSKNELASIYDLIEGGNIKYLIIDEFYKGIGVLTADNMILFTKAFSINIKNKIEFRDIEIKRIQDIKLETYETIISKLPNFKKRKESLSIIINQKNDEDYIIGLLLEDNLIYPLKEEKYDEAKHKLKIENINYVLDLTNTTTSVDTRTKFKELYDYNNYNNIYNQITLELNYFFVMNNAKQTKKYIKFKHHIYNIIDNFVLDFYSKKKLLTDIFSQLIDNITYEKARGDIVFDTNICSVLDGDTCKLSNKCNLNTLDKGDIKLFGTEEKLEFNFKKCKFKITKKEKEEVLNLLIDQIINSYKYRIDLLENDLSKVTTTQNINIIEHTDYISYINNLFDKKNIYKKNSLTKNMKNMEITKNLISIIKNKLDQTFTPEEIGLNPEILNEPTYPSKYGVNYNSKGDIISDSKIKEGQCIFPFYYNGELQHDCVQNEDDEFICATEIDDVVTQKLTKYGFCSDVKSGCYGNTESDILAKTVDSKGTDYSDNPKFKAGKCCFPFVFDGKGYTKKHTDCTKDKSLDSNDKVCATTTDNKHKMITKGFCPVVKKLKIKKGTQTIEATNEDLDEFQPDPSKWEGPIDGILHPKSKIFGTVLKKDGKIWSTNKFHEAIEECEENPECKGVTLRKTKFNKDKYNMRLSNLQRDEPNAKSWIKKTKKKEFQPDPSKWEGPIDGILHSGKGTTVIKTKLPPKNLEAAIQRCDKNPECKGVTLRKTKKNKDKYNLRLSNKQRNEPNAKSWIKKTKTK